MILAHRGVWVLNWAKVDYAICARSHTQRYKHTHTPTYIQKLTQVCRIVRVQKQTSGKTQHTQAGSWKGLMFMPKVHIIINR